jgi:MarR family transcriptional regulator
MYLYNLESTLEACTMNNKVTRFIEAERELSQLKHWLKMTYKISIEEFVVLFKVYEGKKISGKELRDTLHFEMLWDTSKIDVIIRKIYKKELISKLRSETDERQVFYFFNASQQKVLDKMKNEIEAISIAN